MVKNRRIDERVSTNLPAKWDGLSGTDEARIEDLSLGGCFVNATRRVDIGEDVGVEVRPPSGEWLQLRGDVTSYNLLADSYCVAGARITPNPKELTLYR